jgi:hypothetical protein
MRTLLAITLVIFFFFVGCDPTGGALPSIGKVYACMLTEDKTSGTEHYDICTADAEAYVVRWFNECSQAHAAAHTSWICGGDCRWREPDLCLDPTD